MYRSWAVFNAIYCKEVNQQTHKNSLEVRRFVSVCNSFLTCFEIIKSIGILIMFWVKILKIPKEFHSIIISEQLWSWTIIGIFQFSPKICTIHMIKKGFLIQLVFILIGLCRCICLLWWIFEFNWYCWKKIKTKITECAILYSRCILNFFL